MSEILASLAPLEKVGNKSYKITMAMTSKYRVLCSNSCERWQSVTKRTRILLGNKESVMSDLFITHKNYKTNFK